MDLLLKGIMAKDFKVSAANTILERLGWLFKSDEKRKKA